MRNRAYHTAYVMYNDSGIDLCKTLVGVAQAVVSRRVNYSQR